MSDIKAARYVTALARLGKIKDAAEELYLSPPALSMFIKNLENELGTPLFSRNNRTFTPTEAGKLFLRRSQKILEAEQEFRKELGQLLKKTQLHIRLGTYTRRGTGFLVPLAQNLQEQIPEAVFSFQAGSMSQLDEMLQAGKIDLMLVYHFSPRPGLKYIPVWTDHLMLACPETWTKEVMPIEELSDRKLLLPSPQRSIYPYVEHLLRKNSITPHRETSIAAMDVSMQNEISMQNVAAGRGCCFTLFSYIRSYSHISSLHFCQPGEEPVPVQWSLAYRNDLPSPVLEKLKAVIAKQLSALTNIDTGEKL